MSLSAFVVTRLRLRPVWVCPHLILFHLSSTLIQPQCPLVKRKLKRIKKISQYLSPPPAACPSPPSSPNFHSPSQRSLPAVLLAGADPACPSEGWDLASFLPKFSYIFTCWNILKHFLARRTPVFCNFLPNFQTFKHFSRHSTPIYTPKIRAPSQV